MRKEAGRVESSIDATTLEVLAMWLDVSVGSALVVSMEVPKVPQVVARWLLIDEHIVIRI